MVISCINIFMQLPQKNIKLKSFLALPPDNPHFCFVFPIVPFLGEGIFPFAEPS